MGNPSVAIGTELLGRLDPGPEPVALPALRLDQHHPSRASDSAVASPIGRLILVLTVPPNTRAAMTPAYN
jgi:hypothetical protein